MKRLIGWMVVLSVLIFAVAARAADQDMEEKRLRLEAAKKELNNLEWRIELNPIGETKKRAYEDTLSFINGKVSSKELESKGFSRSNYTVSLKGENIIVWETMQTSEKAGLAFWHGELENDAMRGVLSRHPDEKRHLDFSFYSIDKRVIKAEPPEIEEIKPEPAKPEPAKPEPAKPEPAKPPEELKEGAKKIEEEQEQPAPKRKKRSLWW